MKNFIVLILLLGPVFAFGQTDNTLVNSLQEHVAGEGVITIHDEEGVEELVNIQVEANRRMEGVEGWRIQLFSGQGPTGKRNALQVKSKLLNKFPDQDVDLSFTSPNWRVRVGNYRHKHEALPLLNELRELFPHCYIVKDGNVKMNKF
ncbi:SPOR domain-containing protein [Carboxylicivirga mesophila]|uniref:SPOR domain-containing protein n=1 Tax=Carboxylicivirga mesophila TaxID=1166478 RepID=A0ABS5KEN3_9BACT|nr:SPOR domain-containing protein [Carboxylicivirga mesophila]MBS2212793.1 SPOR domain-containing protein [Carboxylicivirga mesophila]